LLLVASIFIMAYLVGYIALSHLGDKLGLAEGDELGIELELRCYADGEELAGEELTGDRLSTVGGLAEVGIVEGGDVAADSVAAEGNFGYAVH
jgi:hypothetical protein